MLSLDTEVTGLDVHHGAKPFLVTTCDEQGEQVFWQADVNPLTRQPEWSEADLEEIGEFLFQEGDRGSGPYILQHSKFDIHALATIGLWEHWNLERVWEDIHDTLIAGHLLASNQPHDLTSMAIQYLGVDIAPYEARLKEACTEARRMARSRFPLWRIAKEGLPEMPSAKGESKEREGRGVQGSSPWKFDMWLPRAIAKELDYPDDHPWWTVASEYANTDSAVTLPLFQVQKAELERRGLWEIYLERLKVLPVVYKMEGYGVTLSNKRLRELDQKYRAASFEDGNRCVAIARKHDYDLVLPKSGNNNSLKNFVFDVLKLPTVGYTEKGNPSLDAKAIEQYQSTLPTGDALDFVTLLRGLRSRGTACTYLEGYERFWLLADPSRNGTWADWYRLYPSLNPTGTDTLRFSSSNPNSQNISKKEDFNLRYCFGPAPGREWWSCDAQNIELRIPAYESGELELIELFEKPNDPPFYGSQHLLNFSTVYPDIWERELKEVGESSVGPHCKKKYAATWYQWCKNGDFAIQYQAGNVTADTAFHREGSHARLKSRFSKLEGLNQKYIQQAERLGYVETMPDSTVNPDRGYPLLCTRSSWGKILPTVPLSYHVQGTACWWIMKAMIRCEKQLSEWRQSGFDGHLAIQVHDEIVFDLPKGQGSEPWKTNLPRVRKLMSLMGQGGNDLGLPTTIGCEYHSENWSEGVSV